MSAAPSWFEDRACASFRDPSMWFSGYPEDIACARAICFGCPVRTDCLWWQLSHEKEIGQVMDGMFGGRTPYERRVILRHRDPQGTHEKVGA